MGNRKLKFTFFITERNLGNKLNKFLKEKGFDKYFLFYAKGSATSNILDYLGIGETEKEVIIYPSNESDAIKMMDCIRESELLKSTIAFRVPVKGISSLKSLEYLLKGVTVDE